MGSNRAMTKPNLDEGEPETGAVEVVRDTVVDDLGVKGAGDAGCRGAASAFVDAVIAALRDLGVRKSQMPQMSERVWRAINHPAE